MRMTFSSVQFSSVAQSCLTLCDPMICSTPGLPHQLPESTQTHVHRVSDAIQPSHPLSSPSPPALSLSQHQGLLQWVSSSHQVAKVLGVSASASVLSINTQDWSPLGWTGWISLLSKGLSSLPTPQFKSINSLALSFLYSPTLTSIHDHWKTVALTFRHDGKRAELLRLIWLFMATIPIPTTHLRIFNF